MSWGERSCVKPCRANENKNWTMCNVDCHGYVWDGVTAPDSTPNFMKSLVEKPKHSLSKHFARNKKKKGA